MMDESVLYGRSLLKEDIPFLLTKDIEKQLNIKSAITTKGDKKICTRCSTQLNLSKRYPCVCGSTCLYCRECINMGKVRECASLYSIPDPCVFKPFDIPCLSWKGELSEQQRMASNQINENIRNQKETILWAVAGAGKTEILFKGIQMALENNKRVCIASPRVDVCLELAPRMQKVFPEVSLVVLYGGVEEAFKYTQFVIATTHQLYRFQDAFDLLIIDEVDAYPFHMNKPLLFAAEKSRKKISSLVYLTATPDKKMQSRIKNKKIEAVILPARYHGFMLPVPQAQYQKNSLMMNKNIEKTRLIKHMKRLINQKKKFLLFVPTITLMEKLQPLLASLFLEVSFECVHSKDPLRKEKVLDMRKENLDFLVTTTILERGVTFANIDVLVWHSDHSVFTEAALVQIAGRVGRSSKYPKGNVTFYHEGWTRAMKRAIRQVKRMNRIARSRGLIQ